MEKYHVFVQAELDRPMIYDVRGNDLAPILSNLRGGIIDDKIMCTKLKSIGINSVTVTVEVLCEECGLYHKIQEFVEIL